MISGFDVSEISLQDSQERQEPDNKDKVLDIIVRSCRFCKIVTYDIGRKKTGRRKGVQEEAGRGQERKRQAILHTRYIKVKFYRYVF